MTSSQIISLWLPEIVRVIGIVRWVIVASLRPSKAFTVRGLLRSSTGRRDCFTSDSSMKLSSKPESANMDTGIDSRENWRDSGRFIRKKELGHEDVRLTRVPSVSGEPTLLARPDIEQGSVRANHIRYTVGGLSDAGAPQGSGETSLTAWAPLGQEEGL